MIDTNILRQEFRNRFHADGTAYTAPGRINLIGEHTDYNGGFVFPGAVDKGITTVIHPNGTDTVNLFAIDLQQGCSFKTNDADGPSTTHFRYVYGVVRELMAAGISVEGFDAVYGGDVPLGAGMSSSAALECCFAFALNDLFNGGLDKMTLAKVGQATEHKYVGVKCGIMDQFASMHGREGALMRLDCRSGEYQYFPWKSEGYRLVLVNSCVKHELVGSPYNDRRILFQYKSPDHEDLSPEQLRYIHGSIDRMENALAAGQYEQVIDVMSFIDYQLAMELSHNVDGYRLSGKFYKRRDSEDPRFKMAIWDFNIAYGNCRYREGWRTDTWVYESNDVLYHDGEEYLVPFWWHKLNSDPNYTARLRERWAQYRSTNVSEERLMATIDSLALVLTSHGAEYRNSQAWPRWGVSVWPNHYIATDFADEIAHMKRWLHERLAWMDAQLGYNP